MSCTSVTSPHVTGLAVYFLSLQPNSDSGFSSSTITTAQMRLALIAIDTKSILPGAVEGTSNALAYNRAKGEFLEFCAALWDVILGYKE